MKPREDVYAAMEAQRALVGKTLYEISKRPSFNYTDILVLLVEDAVIEASFSERDTYAARGGKRTTGTVKNAYIVARVPDGRTYRRDARNVLDSQIDRDTALERVDALIRHAEEYELDTLSAHFVQMRERIEVATNAVFC